MSTIERLIADACLGARSGDELEADLPAFVARYDLPPEQARALVADGRRLLAYRMLVRNNLAGVAFRMMARSRARAAAAFDASFVAFLDAVGPKSHYLRDVPHEFFAWVRERWEHVDTLPKYLVDLASHELTEYAVSAAVAPPSEDVVDLALDRGVAFACALAVTRYCHAVHLLPDDADDTTVPETRDVAVLVYRDAEGALPSVELTPLLARFVERLLSGDTLEAALRTATTEHRVTLDEAALAAAATMLADLGARGVILGGRAR